MLCFCGGKTAITDSRTPKIDEDAANSLVRKGQDLAGWWSMDFTMRRRRCRACGAHTTTIELSCDDFENMLKEAKKND